MCKLYSKFERNKLIKMGYNVIYRFKLNFLFLCEMKVVYIIV